jgi:indole-3-glycerol phosphate synthase
LKAIGYNGFLIGEKFMSTPDPVKAFSEFVKDII